MNAKKLLSAIIAGTIAVSAISLTAMAQTTVELPTATVTKLENEDLTFALNFKADESTEAQLDVYGDWYADFVLTVNKDTTFNANGGADGYLSGQYDAWSENWVNVPFEDVTIKANESFKIMEYAAELMGQSGLKVTYNDVYYGVEDFDCGVFFEDEFLKKNPDLEVALELRMYNPEDETESYSIGKTYKFTTALPKAEVTVLDPMVLTAAEHNYMVWPNGDATIDRPLDVVMNFKALDTLEEAQAGVYAKWKTDFYLTIDGLSKDMITADNCYLAGEYGSYGWIVIPADGLELEEGVSYPVVSAYDANLTYENICDYVKDFTAAIYIDDEIVKANPGITVTLELKMTNPDDENDVLVIGEPAVYTASSLTNKTFVSNIFQGNFNGTAEYADTKAAAIMSEIIMGRGNDLTITNIKWELNGKSTSENNVNFTGEGKISYGIIYPDHLDFEVGDVVDGMVVTY